MTELAANHAARRERVLSTLGDDAVLVLSAAPELVAGRDTELRYRPDSDVYYLSGYIEPEAVLVLAAGAEAPYTLFVRPRDPERELWTGRRGGVEAARERYGADAAFAIGDLATRLPELLAGRASIYARMGAGGRVVDAILSDTLGRGRAARQRTGRGARALIDPGALLDELRLLKDEHEIELMRQFGGYRVPLSRTSNILVRTFDTGKPVLVNGRKVNIPSALLKAGDVVTSARVAISALGSRPRVITGLEKVALGRALDAETADAIARRAFDQCHPLENIPVDPEWRRAMVPVLVRRAIAGAMA